MRFGNPLEGVEKMHDEDLLAARDDELSTQIDVVCRPDLSDVAPMRDLGEPS